MKKIEPYLLKENLLRFLNEDPRGAHDWKSKVGNKLNPDLKLGAAKNESTQQRLERLILEVIIEDKKEKKIIKELIREQLNILKHRKKF